VQVLLSACDHKPRTVESDNAAQAALENAADQLCFDSITTVMGAINSAAFSDCPQKLLDRVTGGMYDATLHILRTC